VRVVLLQQTRDVCLGGDVTAGDARNDVARPEGEEVIARLRRRPRHPERRERRGHAATDVKRDYRGGRLENMSPGNAIVLLLFAHRCLVEQRGVIGSRASSVDLDVR
jgi:hypothetical protein